MSSIKKWCFYGLAFVAMGTAVVWACGPNFGIEVLPSRTEFLLAPPSVSFEGELKALVPAPKDNLPVVEAAENDDFQIKQNVAQPEDMPRLRSGASTADESGGVLAPEIRLYAAGAVSFHHGESASAQSYFQQVLNLPEKERKSRELWARYMLGRLAVKQENQAEAVAQFEGVRALVRRGMPDEFGLAVASFGEQARGAWRHGEIANAVELYATQASYGSQSGANSLVMIAALILKNNDLLDKGIQDSRTRRLLFICLNSNSSRPFFVDIESHAGPSSMVNRIAAALDRHYLTEVVGAGLLASGAYSHGRLDLAQKFSTLEDVPISHWVKAKLALHRGDRETALKEYESALKTFPPEMGDFNGLRAEVATLRVSRGDFVQALDLFYRSAGTGSDVDLNQWGLDLTWVGYADYWGDVAYLAERVLTIEELQTYLNRATSPTYQRDKRSRLRSILARRLMRAGRQHEAIGYFGDPKTHLAAEQYADLLNRANSWWNLPLTRAQAWFTVAKIARYNGMDILGFEKEPDYAIWAGEFDGSRFLLPTHQGPDLFQTEDERKRVAASAPRNDVRFQYRLTAVEHATQAADLLPRSSQAFAAVLCHATEWVINREPSRAEKIYQRYLHQGAHVSWGRSFGRSCPEPNFEAASFWTTRSRQLKHLSRHARVHPILAGLLALLSGTLLTAIGYYYLGLRKQRFT